MEENMKATEGVGAALIRGGALDEGLIALRRDDEEAAMLLLLVD